MRHVVEYSAIYAFPHALNGPFDNPRSRLALSHPDSLYGA